MTSSQHPNRVYFSSLDRSPVDSNTDFTISFDTPIENAKNFEVVTASFPNTFHQFAPYETILYFYHELFFGGTVAIGIPLSTTLFAGATGENAVPSSRPAGRQEYIDGRYFLDGEDLQDYLNDWIQSLSVSWPTQASGLRPFYHTDDDPTKPIVYVASEVASGITFSALSFDYDTTTSAGGRGSLKFIFTDGGGNDVRIASIVDFGVLGQAYLYPSQLGFKIGFTELTQQAFGNVVVINSTNNQFKLSAQKTDGLLVDGIISLNPLTEDLTISGLASRLQTAITSPSNPIYEYFTGMTVTFTGLQLQFNFPSPSNALSYLIDFRGFTGARDTLGFVNNLTQVSLGATITPPNNVVVQGGVTPAPHVAPNPINLIRTSNIYFASTLAGGEALSSAGRKDILFAVALTAPVGSVQLYQSSLSGLVINRPPDVLRNIRLTLLDDNFQVMEAMPQNANISIEIHFAYTDENQTNNISTIRTY